MKNHFFTLLIFCTILFSNASIFAQNCTTPPTPIVTGKVMNLVQYPDKPKAIIKASDFDIGSYANCGSITAFSFSTDVNDREKTFDCGTSGTQPITLFITDTEGNQAKIQTFILVQDIAGLCSNPQPTTSCPHELVLNNGFIVALSNNGTARINTANYVKRLDKDCTGNAVVNFAATNNVGKILTQSDVGTSSSQLIFTVDNNPINRLFSIAVVKEALSTTNCVPVPIVHNAVTSAIGLLGTVQLNAKVFNVGSYSDCGGEVALSFSSDINDTLKTLTGAAVFSDAEVEIWATDKQTGSQNKTSDVVLVQDLISPTCVNLPPVQKDCSDYQQGVFGASTDANGNKMFDNTEYQPLSGALLAAYNANFGAPNCSDNNQNVTVKVEQQYQLITDNCGTQIRRRYRSRDASVNLSVWTEQNISFMVTPNCQPNMPPPNAVNITGTIATDSTFRAASTITSTATIAATTNVTYLAGQSVTLNAGFQTIQGSTFRAAIDNCTNAISNFREDEVQKVTLDTPVYTSQNKHQIESKNTRPNFKIFPNPAKDEVHLVFQTPSTKLSILHIYDIVGNLVISQTLDSHTQNAILDVGFLSNGTYLLKVQDGKNFATKKLLIHKN